MHTQQTNSNEIVENTVQNSPPWCVTFSELKPKRKLLILELLAMYPECMESGTITLSQIKNYQNQRKLSPQKMNLVSDDVLRPAHPLFLYGEKEFRAQRRGSYILPMPTENESAQFLESLISTPQKKVKVVVAKKGKTTQRNISKNESDELTLADIPEEYIKEFQEECARAGVLAKAVADVLTAP